MARMTFGSVLQEARERKGYDLATAARRLRIRPDILRAIEDNDFSRMPPRGYTRNMVNAYARLLGLNPTEITRMYLDEAYAYQVGRARSDVRPAASGFDMGEATRTRRSSRTVRQEEEPVEHVPRQNAFGRALYDDRTAYSRADYGQRDGANSGSDRRYSEGRTHTSRHTALPTTQYTNFYAGPKAPNGVQSKLPFIIAGAVILVLLIVVLVLVFGNKGNNSGDVPKVPVTGLTDTTQSGQGDGEQQQQQQTPVEAAPTSVQVVYEVAKGQDPYAVITVNGTASQVFLTAGSKETVDVTGTWSLACWMSDSVTVTVNGEKVAFDTTAADGAPMVSVDFNTYLEKWKTDHPNATTSGTKSSSTTEGQTANASTSGTGSSTGTSTSA